MHKGLLSPGEQFPKITCNELHEYMYVIFHFFKAFIPDLRIAREPA